jgi:hypothetical protein
MCADTHSHKFGAGFDKKNGVLWQKCQDPSGIKIFFFKKPFMLNANPYI